METADTLLKPGEQIKPNVPSEVIHSLLKDLYNLEVESFKELNSYDDKNFFIKVLVIIYFHDYSLKETMVLQNSR